MANEPRTTPLLPLLLLLIFPAAGATRPPFACDPRDRRTGLFPFCKTSLPVSDRVSDLIRRLTLPEKISLLVDNAAPVERLGVQAYEWWSEALHGVSNVGPGTRFAGNIPRATSFPQVILTAASFNTTLWEEIGQVVSTEGRAMYNTGLAGLTFWSPNVNIFRDPRWGRGQETPGEDPAVAGKYAASYVRGLQQSYGKDGSRLKVAACCKHYTAYDLDNWRGTDRFHFNAQVSKQDLKDTYEVPFKTCVVEGKVASVMCSYNQVNGVPTCADRDLLLDTVRHEWGLNGYIVSDCDSVGVFYDSQHYTRTPEDAAATAIKAGLDLDCGPFLGLHTQAAVQQGKVSEMEVEFALRNTIAVQMRLGMFDGDPAGQPFGQLGPNDICTPANRQLAHETARQGIVLLKNLDHALPLPPPRYRTIAVIGPNADATVTMIGNYAGIPCRYTSPLKGIGEYTHAIHQPGCSDVACNQKELFDAAVEAARNADATVMVMGLDQSIEAENIDRESLLLPGYQEELVNRVSWASKGPTILVLMCGGPLDVSFAKRDPRVHAILWVGYPGEAGGRAIADVIFGQHNPGGKLPMTWYREDFVTKVPMTSMDMRADPSKGYPGRTHRFYDGEPVFSFGQGMSYTNFAHSLAEAPTMLSVPLDGGRLRARNITHSRTAVRVTHARCDGLTLQVNVDVKNTGPVDGSHVVFVFSTPPPGHGAPSRQLVAFERLTVLAGAQRQVQFAINVCRDLSIVDVNGIRRLPIGDHGLQIGDLTHSVSLQVEAGSNK